MAYGSMTEFLLAQFVGTPGGGVGTTTQLADIPMWYALFSANPLTAGDPLAVEILGGTYERPAASWDAFGLTGLVSAADVPFEGLPPGTLATHIGLFDADVNGNLLAADAFDESLAFPDGGTWIMPAGEFFLGWDLTGL